MLQKSKEMGTEKQGILERRLKKKLSFFLMNDLIINMCDYILMI